MEHSVYKAKNGSKMRFGAWVVHTKDNVAFEGSDNLLFSGFPMLLTVFGA